MITNSQSLIAIGISGKSVCRAAGEADRATELRRGFTLIELIIALSVSLVVTVMSLQIFSSVGVLNFDSTAKLKISKDIRTFTNDLTANARSATAYRIYKADDDLTEMGSDEQGDVLALVWADPEPIEDVVDGVAQKVYYTRLVVFARTIDDATLNVGPVKKYERVYPSQSVLADDTSIAIQTAATLLNADGLSEVSEVVELTRGLADEKLFFLSRTGDSVTINGEIYHGNANRRVTNTYNFTVRPRG